MGKLYLDGKEVLADVYLKGTLRAIGTVTLPAVTLGGNITLPTNLNIIGDYIIQPNIDGEVCLGQDSNRFKVVRAITIASGDVLFENEWRLTEDEVYGVVLVSPQGKKFKMMEV